MPGPPLMDGAVVRAHARGDEGLSKLMVTLLRHRAPEVRLGVTPEGFALLDGVAHHLSNWTRTNVTCEDVQNVVGSSFHKNGQPRFEIAYGRGDASAWIRAMRRHSIPTVIRPGDRPPEFSGQDPRAMRQEAAQPRPTLAEARAIAEARTGATAEADRKALEAETRAIAAERRMQDMLEVDAERRRQVEELTRELQRVTGKLEAIEAWLGRAPGSD